MRTVLNKEQNDAYGKILAFLLGSDQGIILDGSGGTGKSFLIAYMYQNLLRDYQNLAGVLTGNTLSKLAVSSTTNKACKSLSAILKGYVPTIHSLLNLTLTIDYKTGMENLTPTQNYSIQSDTIFIIDECSQINKELFRYILKNRSCKFIFVGDKSQLSPVKEVISPVYQQGYQVLSLKQYMRQQKPELIQLADICKQAVDTHKVKLPIDGQCVIHLDKSNTFTYLSNDFKQASFDHYVACYTNECAMAYNKYIHSQVRQLQDAYYKGQYLISNNVIHPHVNQGINQHVVNNTGVGLWSHIEDEFEVLAIKPIETITVNNRVSGSTMNYKAYPARVMNITSGKVFNTYIPANYSDIRAIMNMLAKKHDWSSYYYIKNYVPDFRTTDAATVHKLQGATLKEVLVDLDNLSTCRNPDTFFRLLYVACTRAREKVYLYGSLAPKYGELIYGP